MGISSSAAAASSLKQEEGRDKTSANGYSVVRDVADLCDLVDLVVCLSDTAHFMSLTLGLLMPFAASVPKMP